MSDSPTVLREAAALVEAGTPAEAVRRLVAWTSEHPDDAAAWELLAKVHFNLRHWLPARMAAAQVTQPSTIISLGVVQPGNHPPEDGPAPRGRGGTATRPRPGPPPTQEPRRNWRSSRRAVPPDLRGLRPPSNCLRWTRCRSSRTHTTAFSVGARYPERSPTRTMACAEPACESI